VKLEIWFWIAMFVWLLFGFWRARAESAPYYAGGHFLTFILFVIIGWQVFGAPVK
jgi:hypothetical protein